MKVKICGITNTEDALIAEEFGADALGFVFYKQSKRFIDFESAKKIIDELSPFITKVGVFVNASADEINMVSKNIKLNLIQLHGDETPDFATRLNLPVIKSFRVNNTFNYDLLYEFKYQYILLDSFSESEKGGTGKKFSWENIPHELRGKIILAGGISTDNLEIICSEIKPYAIDVSSSLESSPGKKDMIKMKDFFFKLNSLRNKSC
jgi:phosphoribosylanthranilate isomerase